MSVGFSEETSGPVNKNHIVLLLCFRLQELVQGESQLKTELQESYKICAQLLKKRMEDILDEVKVRYSHFVLPQVWLCPFLTDSSETAQTNVSVTQHVGLD